MKDYANRDSRQLDKQRRANVRAEIVSVVLLILLVVALIAIVRNADYIDGLRIVSVAP